MVRPKAQAVRPKVIITKMLGGGTSWFYAMKGNTVIGASHELDKEGMKALRLLKRD